MKPFNLALVTTAYFTYSHADVICSRWFVPRESDRVWGWQGPRSKIVSLYVDQPEFSPPGTQERPQYALAQQVCREHGIAQYPTIAAALCRGGATLAVDGVLLIGEHGQYPANDIGQTLYPRKAMFDQILQVFKTSVRTAPIFCDKHLSWNFAWARQMYDNAQQMHFALINASSIPQCKLSNSIHLKHGDVVREAVATFTDNREDNGYHSIEFVQAQLEKRRGGETGVRSVTAYAGPSVWTMLNQRPSTRDLLNAAIAAARGSSPEEDQMPALMAAVTAPQAYVIEHNDGLRVTHVHHGNLSRRFTIAVATDALPSPRAAFAVVGNYADYFAHFAALSNKFETAMLSGVPPFPPQRGLLTTGLVAAFCKAFAQPGRPLATPELDITYQSMGSAAWPG